MAWIEMLSSDEWNGDLAHLVGDPSTGHIDNIMGIHSLNAGGMAAHHAVYSSAMRGTATLRKVDRELVAFVVSQANDCHY